MKRLLPLLILMLFGVTRVQAHAALDHAEPKVGSTVEEPPALVKVWFSEGIEPAFSKLEVADASDHRIDKDDAHVDDKDEKLLIVSLPALKPGTYTVTWKVVAKDTHRTHGTFQFTVQPK